MANERNAGRKKGNRFNVKYWTDGNTHQAIKTIVELKKDKEVSEDDFKKMCRHIKEIQYMHLEKTTNSIIGKTE